MPSEEKQYDFKPVDFDVNELRAMADEGHYRAKISEVKLSKTSKDEYPMLIVEYTLTEALDEQEQGEGLTATDFLVFFPKGESKGDFGREKMRQLLEKAGIDRDVVPTRIETKADFDDLITALKGAKLDIWISHKDRDVDGEKIKSANVNYKAKGGKASGSNLPKDDDDDQPARITKGTKTNGTNGTHGKTNGKKRN